MQNAEKRIAALERTANAGGNVKVVIVWRGETLEQAKKREGVQDSDETIAVSFVSPGHKLPD